MRAWYGFQYTTFIGAGYGYITMRPAIESIGLSSEPMQKNPFAYILSQAGEDLCRTCPPGVMYRRAGYRM